MYISYAGLQSAGLLGEAIAVLRFFCALEEMFVSVVYIKTHSINLSNNFHLQAVGKTSQDKRSKRVT